jgi:dynein assembly factor with WDR repeat domains 1
VQVSSAQFNFQGDQVLSGSIDMTARIWDTRRGSCLSIKRGHTDEVLHVAFNASGSHFASASADGTARLYDSASGLLVHKLCGHTGEVSKVLSALNIVHSQAVKWQRVVMVKPKCLQMMSVLQA